MGGGVSVEVEVKGKGEDVSIEVEVKVESEGMSVKLEVEDEEEGSVRVRAEGEGEDRRVESHDGCRGGGKHTGSESVRVLFRAGCCTHLVGDWWGEQNEKRGTAVSRGTDQHGNVSFFFVFFFNT
jgi:hypothetical protein